MLDKVDDGEYLGLLRLILGESGRFAELSGLYVHSTVLPGYGYLSGYLRAHAGGFGEPMLFMGPLVGFVLLQAGLDGRHWMPFDRDRYAECLSRRMRWG
jgi:hypothetical protein